MSRSAPFLVVCVLLVSAASAAADVTVGLPADTGDGNCFPFGCNYLGLYQQVYSHTQFAGPITITNLEFFNTEGYRPTSSLNSGTWTISLSTTAADWNTLSGTFANNIGGDNTTVFSGNLGRPWAFGHTLHIVLSTPFTYDPAAGNLLMDVVSYGVYGESFVYFDTNGVNYGGLNGNTFLGRVYGSGAVNHGYGLVTGFSTASAVPEPGTLTLLGFGLAGLGVFLRRRA